MQSLKSLVQQNYLTIFGCFLFLLIGIYINLNRHYYDDEIITINLIQDISFTNLYYFINTSDVHPPLSYLVYSFFFNKDSLLLSTIFQIILNTTSLAYFYNYLKSKHLNSKIAWVLIFLNSNILMWCLSLRWYSLWIPISIFLFTYILKSNKTNILFTLIILSILFHINYVTLPIWGIIILFYWQNFNFKISNISIIIIISLGIINIPQFYFFMEYHLPNSDSQTYFSIYFSTINTLSTIFLSNAHFPIHYLLLFPTIFYLIILFSTRKILIKTFKQKLFLILLLITSLFIITGIGGKPRNSIFLHFLFNVFLIIHLLPFIKKPISKLLFIIILTYSIGCSYNLITYSNTNKGNINLPVHNIIESIGINRKIITYDSVLDYYLIDKNTLLLSENITYVNPNDTVYIIHTFPGLMSIEEYKRIQDIRTILYKNSTLLENHEIGKDNFAFWKQLLNTSPYPIPNHYARIEILKLNKYTSFKDSANIQNK